MLTWLKRLLGCSCVFAFVDANGTIGSSRGVVLGPGITGRNGVGLYQVQFNRDVSTCAPVATIGTPPPFVGAVPKGAATVGFSSNTQVEVATYDMSGNQADLPFYLVATC